MKSFWLSTVIVLTPFLSQVSAFGERGIAERMLYWMAYLCEEEIVKLDSTYTMTVAPGCSGARSGRCTFDQLLQYIWHEDIEAKDTVPPTGMKTPSGVDDTLAFNYNQFFGRVQNARFNTGFGVDGVADSNKLMPGVGDYYAVLAEMGKPIQALSSICTQKMAAAKNGGAPFKIGNYRMKIWGWGKDSAYLVTGLRRKDMDSYRVGFLENYFKAPAGLSGGFVPVMMELDNPLKTDMPAIDFDATIAKYKAAVPNIEALLNVANRAYMDVKKNGQLFNAAHNKALEAARKATTSASCTRGYPRNLKRRGGPLAAKSRKVKVRKLAMRGDVFSFVSVV